jgi:hypothetical protein
VQRNRKANYISACMLLVAWNYATAQPARPPIDTLLPKHFAFGVSSFGGVLEWPGQVKESHQIQWDFLYWYQLMNSSKWFLETKLARAEALGAIPIITHYQLKERGLAAGYSGANSWDVVIAAVQDPSVMRAYFDNVEWIMKAVGTFGKPTLFQTEPDSTTWLRMFHTDGSNIASNGYVAVQATGHPDLQSFPNTIAGYAQALIHLRDIHAPTNCYMGLCEFDNRNGHHPERSVQFIQSLQAPFDILFTHHTIKYSTKGDLWWEAYSETDQNRFLNWIKTITKATGLNYIHWQAEIGPADYGLMPNYPTEERISDLIAAGSVAVLFDLYSLNGPPHHQPQHGFTTPPPENHPACNSLEKLAERLATYYAAPIQRHTIITSYQAWTRLFFSEQERTDPLIIGLMQDPDLDGIINIQEYAFGLNPTEKNRSGLPTIHQPTPDSSEYTLSFNPYAEDLTLKLWISTNLYSWTEKMLGDNDIHLEKRGALKRLKHTNTHRPPNLFYKTEIQHTPDS